MTPDTQISRAVSALDEARRLIRDELAAYPTPLSGCDVQYNYLIERRAQVTDALAALAEQRFVATPRLQAPGAAVESR